MNVFESVKMGVSMTGAAERYGVTVNRSRKALCPFHNDRNPSLFVADDHYTEAVQLADVLGYEIVWKKRGDR